MGNFRPGGQGGGFKGRGGFGGGRPSFGGNRGGGFRGDRGPVVMNKAVCDQCHQPCEVPFRPTAGKPVYCNACFGSKKELNGNDRGNRGGFRSDYKTPPRTDFGNDIKKVSGEEIKKQIETLNVKIDRLAKLIEEMKNDKMTAPEIKVSKKVVKVKRSKKANS